MDKGGYNIKNNNLSECPMVLTLNLMGSHWKILIVERLFTGTKRFNELKRSLPNISQKVLTQHLRDMEKSKLIKREVYAEVPPHVEYSLTEIGRSVKSIHLVMEKWGVDYKKNINI
jgi:DNA-binding HxlR family transcriptional regulator